MKITEQYVLDNCLHNTDEVLEKIFFPLFKDELVRARSVNIKGHYSPIIREVNFDYWRRLRYSELRKARYGEWSAQLEMIADGTFHSHIENVKASTPKP